ncbi:hypothetical protein Cgig2_010433 [Carnegiea gigantea]|uniref:Reverse transcriptase zinc-binding domain-containing protein n=1 Tax=Carnegiea gigantea TaxID=171969 RepID=A0A9Q1JH69_9CARY|nr:hypothetical protein Cgig2_010433 [Carnegiea gigantea]
MRQQSKLEWLNSGDHYTKLFFAKMKQRKQANYIYSINDATGTIVDDFSAVAKTLTDFYQQLLGKQKIHYTHVSQKIMEAGPILTIVQQLMLCFVVTQKEINKVMFSIPNEKSPGPNRYSSGFFKACLGEIGSVGSSELKKWHWKSNPNGDYRVIFGYEWYLNLQHRKPRWTKLVWPRPATPRHSFIAWLLLKQKLPVNTRVPCPSPCLQGWYDQLLQLTLPRIHKEIICSMLTTAVYYMWRARNELKCSTKRSTQKDIRNIQTWF